MTDEAAALEVRLREDKPVSSDRDHALEQVLEAARLDSQGEYDAQMAVFGFFGRRQGRWLRKLSLGRLHGRVAS